MTEPVDPTRFRRVLGHYPTGVAVITASVIDGAPVGMSVGSFVSVSLEPPLVAFLADKSSTTFPFIREAGTFCVNVLAADQEHVCRAFSARGADKFAEIAWKPSPAGAPILAGAVAWIECEISQISEAGDHWLMIGHVVALDVAKSTAPLIFFQGGFQQILWLNGADGSPDQAVPGDVLEDADAIEH